MIVFYLKSCIFATKLLILQPKALRMPSNGAGIMILNKYENGYRFTFDRRATSYFIHNITNYVAMKLCGKSPYWQLGADPQSWHAPRKRWEEMCSKSNALALNLGIFETVHSTSMLLAGKAASKSRIPIVFDVCWSRCHYGFEWILHQIDLFNASQQSSRGNASEIRSLYSHQIGMQGVDSHLETSEVEDRPNSCQETGMHHRYYRCYRHHHGW